MSSVADDARAAVILADFGNPDPTGKANLLGAGWQITQITGTGMTAPCTLAVFIETPPAHVGSEFAVSLTLRNEAGDAVTVPGPTGVAQAMRIQQIIKAERPSVPGIYLHDRVWSRSQVIIHFANGLPLPPGTAYTWELEIDGNTNPQWRAGFLVAGASPNPVIG